MDVLIECIAALFELTAGVFTAPCLKRRIREHLELRGASAVKIRWSPFASGWLSHWQCRFFTADYIDSKGREVQAVYRTNIARGMRLHSRSAIT